MGVKLSEMTADTSVAGTEKILVLDGTTSKTMTTAVLGAYVIDVLGAAASATPTTGDLLSGFRSTDEKRFTLDTVAAYAITYAYSSATTANPTLTADSLLILRSGTVYDMTVDSLKTFCNTGIQATVLDVSGLSSATLDATDLLPICEGTSAKKATLAELETKLWTDFATYTGALTPTTTVAAADKLYILQSGTPKYVSATVFSDYVSVDAAWRTVTASKYTATPASTSTIAMSDTSDFQVGYPVKYTYGGTAYYGMVTTVTTNTLIYVTGAPLDTGVALTALAVGRPERIVTKEFFIDTASLDAVQDIFSAVTYERHRWDGADAYLVSFAATLGVADTGTQPKLNVKIGSGLVGTGDSNKGIQLSATPGTWVAPTAVAFNTTNYDVVMGDLLEIRCTEAGTNGDADCLSVICTFVLE
jgi:hypothetical protein